MKQQSIMLNANCQLIQCTHITDLLSNLRRLLDSMNIKVFIAMRNVSCSQMVQNTSPSLYTNEKCKSNFNNNSSKVYLMFSSESVINKIAVLTKCEAARRARHRARRARHARHTKNKKKFQKYI